MSRYIPGLVSLFEVVFPRCRVRLIQSLRVICRSLVLLTVLTLTVAILASAMLIPTILLRTMRPMKPTMPAGTRSLPRHSGMSTFCRSVNELVQRTLSPLPDASELAYFMLLFTIEMITSLVLETNLYAEQCQAARGVRDSAWQPTTVEEMRAYIAVNILMGFHQLLEIDHYWSSDDMLGVPGVMKIMAKHRFKKLTQYFHANDNSKAAARGGAGYDPLHKVRPLLSSASSSFARRYRPGKDLSIDEAMIAFKGRSFMKQYLPAKPIKWGFKVWTIAEAATGYVCGFQVYVGKRAAPSANGLGYDVVMELSEMYQYQRRHLYFDNFFSSIKLLRDLEQQQTYACATVRSNRAGLPLVVKQPGRLARGSSVKRQSGT